MIFNCELHNAGILPKAFIEDPGVIVDSKLELP
jgi:hypothetical protein